MAFNGSGTFNRPVSDYVFDTPISESDMNTEMDGIATGLSNVIAKDGQTTITANLPMAGFRHTGIGVSSARDMYPATSQVQDGGFTYGGVAGGTANALTVTFSPAIIAFATGQRVAFISSASPNTGAATINPNGTGAVAIEFGGAAVQANDILASRPYEGFFDGTALQLSYTSRVAVPAGHLQGGTLSNDTDTDHDINVTACVARDSANATNLILAAEITKQIDATWVAGDDAGGLSSSLTAPANATWYHVFLIKVAGVVDVGFDTSVTAANLVTDHSATSYRRIGSVRTDGSANIIGFYHRNDTFMWDVRNPSGSQDLVTTSPSTTQANVTLTAPLGIVTEAIFTGQLALATASFIIFDRVSTTIPVPGITNSDLNTATGYNSTMAEFRRFTDTSSQISYRCNLGTPSVNIRTLGWVDSRIV